MNLLEEATGGILLLGSESHKRRGVDWGKDCLDVGPFGFTVSSLGLRHKARRVENSLMVTVPSQLA